MRAGLRALPVFWQTLALVVASLFIAQVVGFLMLFVAPPPRPDFNRLSDIVDALSGKAGEQRGASPEWGDRERALTVLTVAALPPPPPGMTSDPAFVAELAQRLAVAKADVRLFFEPDRPLSLFGRRGRRRPVAIHNGEPLFFTPIAAALRSGKGWRLARTAPPPLIAPWQQRQMLWFAASLLVVVPLAWGFARAITRPIRRFADAADRLGSDPQAPAVAEEGPAELRVTARALNHMHRRLADYIGERTAMIGAIAHDLRTPLARIAFRIEGAPEQVRDKVLGDVDQMRAMLAATIGFVRSTQTSAERVPVDLADLLGGLAAQDRDMGREVALTAPPRPVIVTADPLAIERLFQNLIDNGTAYGGAIEIGFTQGETMAEVIVADRGPGMPPEMLERAFQPFVRGEPSRNRATGGIGLGLTIARTISEDHGGTLRLRNRAGGGLEAICCLPLAA